MPRDQEPATAAHFDALEALCVYLGKNVPRDRFFSTTGNLEKDQAPGHYLTGPAYLTIRQGVLFFDNRGWRAVADWRKKLAEKRLALETAPPVVERKRRKKRAPTKKQAPPPPPPPSSVQAPVQAPTIHPAPPPARPVFSTPQVGYGRFRDHAADYPTPRARSILAALTPDERRRLEPILDELAALLVDVLLRERANGG